MVANKGFKEKEILCNFVNTNKGVKLLKKHVKSIHIFTFELYIFTQGGLLKFFHP